MFDWRYPFQKNTFDAINCTEENYNKNWQYIPKMKRRKDDIRAALNYVIIDVREQYKLALEECTEFFKFGKFGQRKYRLLFDGLDEYPNFFVTGTDTINSINIILNKTIEKDSHSRKSTK